MTPWLFLSRGGGDPPLCPRSGAMGGFSAACMRVGGRGEAAGRAFVPTFFLPSPPFPPPPPHHRRFQLTGNIKALFSRQSATLWHLPGARSHDARLRNPRDAAVEGGDGGGGCGVTLSHPTQNPPEQPDPAFTPSQGLTAPSVASFVALSQSRAWRQLVALEGGERGGACHRARGCPRGTWATLRQTVPGTGLAHGLSRRFPGVCGSGDPKAPPWGLAAQGG